MNAALLQGRRLLVVEDEYLIAIAMQRDLEGHGAVVVGPAPSVRRALGLLGGGPVLDGAVLDINLGSETVFPVAEALERRRVPFLFATGYDAADVPRPWGRVPRVEKPVEVAVIARILFGDEVP